MNRDPQGLNALANHVATTSEGSRNAMLCWAAMRAVEEDYPDNIIVNVLAMAGLAAGLEAHETGRTIKSGIDRAEKEGKRRNLVPPSLDDSWKTLRQKYTEDGYENEVEAASDGIVNIVTYLKDVPLAVPWVVLYFAEFPPWKATSAPLPRSALAGPSSPSSASGPSSRHSWIVP